MRVAWKKARVRLERPQGPGWETQATGVWRWGHCFMGSEALAHRMLGTGSHALLWYARHLPCLQPCASPGLCLTDLWGKFSLMP